jgi:hypothetical protein
MIDSNVIQKVTPATIYPTLMISNTGTLVLFSCAKVGTVLRSKTRAIGVNSELWNMQEFTVFHGTIELSNKEDAK